MANTPICPSDNGFFVGATELSKYLVGVGRQSHIDSAAPSITNIDGYPYLFDREKNTLTPVGHNRPIEKDPPVPAPYRFFTLQGLVDYIVWNAEGLIPGEGETSKLILHVVDEGHVALVSHPSLNNAKRYVIAECFAHVPEIHWERYMDVDTFNTQLLSKFIDTEARTQLFKVVKSMTKEQSCNTSDDGVSQVITVTQGVSMAANVQFQNPIPLKPMRTFAEIDQPESNFTLRVNEDARAALFEADGGAWKNEAVKSIAEYLECELAPHHCNVIVLA